ncbi:MAG: methyltransferase domain-containing protein [Bacilli bacterium]|nr:methyltransferase domain-containing protein [Bacilli bacterium]
MYEPYKWEFNEEVAQCFDQHVRQSVFMYDEFHKSIIKMSNWFIEDNTNILDVGTSTGELLMKLPYNETCNYIGIDVEDGMINKAQEKLGEKYKLQLGDILDYKITNCSLITMVLVLQFIKNKDKELALQNIYNSLNKGGAFMFVDKVKTPILDIHDMYNDLYYDFKRENDLTDTEILDKNVSLRGVQKCLTVEENIQLMKNVGFKNIDIFLKYNNFVGIIAIK